MPVTISMPAMAVSAARETAICGSHFSLGMRESKDSNCESITINDSLSLLLYQLQSLHTVSLNPSMNISRLYSV